MAFAAIQTGNVSNSFSGTTCAPSWNSNTTINNLVVVHIIIADQTTTVSSVTDDVGNTYVIGSPLAFGVLQRIYQCYGVQVTGNASQVTVTLSVGADAEAFCDEYSGNATTNATVIDASTTGTGISTSGSVSTLTTAATGELIVGTIGTDNYGVAAGSGYTLFGVDGGLGQYSQYKLSGAATETAPFTCTVGAWGEIARAYKPSAAPPPTRQSNFFFG